MEWWFVIPHLLTNVFALPGEIWTPEIVFSVMLGIRRDHPPHRIETKFCVVSGLQEIVLRLKFHQNWLSGFSATSLSKTYQYWCLLKYVQHQCRFLRHSDILSALLGFKITFVTHADTMSATSFLNSSAHCRPKYCYSPRWGLMQLLPPCRYYTRWRIKTSRTLRNIMAHILYEEKFPFVHL